MLLYCFGISVDCRFFCVDRKLLKQCFQIDLHECERGRLNVCVTWESVSELWWLHFNLKVTLSAVNVSVFGGHWSSSCFRVAFLVTPALWPHWRKLECMQVCVSQENLKKQLPVYSITGCGKDVTESWTTPQCVVDESWIVCLYSSLLNSRQTLSFEEFVELLSEAAMKAVFDSVFDLYLSSYLIIPA